MVSRELIEEIAARYNIGVSYGLSNTGGFITDGDGTGTVKSSILEEFFSDFNMADEEDNV